MVKKFNHWGYTYYSAAFVTTNISTDSLEEITKSHKFVLTGKKQNNNNQKKKCHRGPDKILLLSRSMKPVSIIGVRY